MLGQNRDGLLQARYISDCVCPCRPREESERGTEDRFLARRDGR